MPSIEEDNTLISWLSHVENEPNYEKFSYFCFEENFIVNDTILEKLTEILLSTILDENCLREICSKIEDREKIKDFIESFLPENIKVRRGYFGEALVGEVLNKFFDWIIPIYRNIEF